MTVLIIVLIFFGLMTRLLYIQIISGDFLHGKAALQWARALPLNAQRGLILDVNGAPLAANTATYDVYVRPVMIENAPAAANLLSNWVDISYDEALRKVSNRKTSEVLIKLQVPRQNALQIIAANQKGIYLAENNKRDYIGGDLLTHVLGYTTIDGVGQTGLEVYYNDYLKGVDGKALTQTDARGKEMENNLTEYIASRPGIDLTLTIDLTIQTFLEEALNRIMSEHLAKSASAIIMNAKTGGIVAMGSKPSFDLNNPPRDDISALNALSKNSMITDVYEPGSTFKLLTLAAALEERLTDLNEMFFCPGYRIIDGQRIKCWKTSGHGIVSLVDGVAVSCNCVFMDLGLRLGVTRLYKYLRAFGIGEKTGIDFFGESRGILINEKNVKNVDLARIAFGQTIAVTPLQLVLAETAVINGGKVFKPQFLAGATSNDGKRIYAHSANIKRKVLSNITSEKIRFMMREGVERSNAIAAYVPGYTLGGKTGTAQKYLPNGGGVAQGKYISSFVGFAPYEDPEYVMLLMVDEPGTGAYYGSIVAAPYGKYIFENLFAYKQIAPKNLEEELKRLEPTIVVPEFSGMDLGQAMTTIRKLGLICEVQGEGSFIENQWPKANVKVYGGAVVVLQTD